MCKKIICFFISMTFLLNLTVTTFANDTNDTKKIFMDSFQKTSTVLNNQLETLITNSNLSTMLEKNINNPKEIEIIFNFESGTNSFSDNEINKFDAKINFQYDLTAFKFHGKVHLKNIVSNEVAEAELYLSPEVMSIGLMEKEFYYEKIETPENKINEYIDLEKLNQLAEKSVMIDEIIARNINKGEFISNGNNSYTLKLSTPLVNATIEEVINEIKNDKNYISVLRNTSSFEGLTDAEIIEGFDYIVMYLSDEGLEMVYDIEINDNGLINKQSISFRNKDGYSATIYIELAEDKNVINKIKMTLLDPDLDKEEVLFETSGNTSSENGIKNYKADIYIDAYYMSELTNLISFRYSLNENVKKDNFTFSFIGNNEILDLPIEIKNLVGSLEIDTSTGNISYTIENGKIDNFYNIVDIIFDMSFKTKDISSDAIKLPKYANKAEETTLSENKVFG